MLPRSVIQRVKAPYPSTQDTGYVVELRRQAADALRSGNGALALFDQPAMAAVATADPKAVDTFQRFGLERLLDVVTWFDACHPRIQRCPLRCRFGALFRWFRWRVIGWFIGTTAVWPEHGWHGISLCYRYTEWALALVGQRGRLPCVTEGKG
jgi:hypothetical protein